MELRLLGPVELWDGGRPVDLGAPRQRAVLAALAWDAGRLVRTDELVDRVWGDEPPARARESLHSYVARIRRVLADCAQPAPVRLASRSGGYVLECAPELVDVHLFQALTAAGPGHPDPERLRQALDLWRGRPLSDVSGPWADRVRAGLDRRHLDTVLAWADGQTRRGDTAPAVAALSDLSAQHPLSEPVTAALMRALHAAGHGAEALRQYAALAARLAEELGADPGAELQAVHRSILRGEPPAAVEPAPPVASPPTVTGPAMLPPDVYGFTGREAQLARLDAVLAKSAQQATAVVIGLVTGTAGVGKTTLAVHWAHRTRDRFPDGQLYLDLRGFAPGSAVPTADAARRLLDALSVPSRRRPSEVDAQLDLYRSELAGRRVLVLLDNARDEAQVRPLLPGSSTAMVIVTSRNRMPGLIATNGAQPVAVDLLSDDEARALLAYRLDDGRAAAEPRAAEHIVRRCARLPLALAVVAARAAQHPEFPLSRFAADLAGPQAGLDALTGDDTSTDVRAVLSSSYRALDPAAARLFRLLGVWSGPQVTLPAAASLGALPVAQAQVLLARLAQAHLLTEVGTGRYVLHDLLSAYAAELARHRLDPDGQRRALRRLLDHYLHTAQAAALVLYPQRDHDRLSPAEEGTVLDPPATLEAAFAWFDSEMELVAAAAQQAAASGFDQHVGLLARASSTFLHRRGRWHEQAVLQTAALHAARRLGDAPAEARANLSLGHTATALGRNEEALIHYARATAQYSALGDLDGQAQTHFHLSWMQERAQRLDDALHHAEQALRLSVAAGSRAGQADALNSVGWYHALRGDHDGAIRHCRQSLELHQLLGNRSGQANAWDSIGYSHARLGRHREAITHYRMALELFQQVESTMDEAEVLDHLGDAYAELGEHSQARESWARALRLLDPLDHPDAAAIRAKLA
ncbi:tetratricopeptide repeat protein [Catellatospora sp. NPDC049609]|uniref:AfsR/SARP family transcriptional regulator n=1 Tax=Catellatospora sp. NPDC049609 TaxID=3155505 RepID=UPI00343E92D1